MTYNPKQLDAATAMMLAADLVEQRFDFFQTKARLCEDWGGCPGAWIAYVLGLEDADAAFEWLGFHDLFEFAGAMSAAVGPRWTWNPTFAAEGLRRLAQERMG